MWSCMSPKGVSIIFFPWYKDDLEYSLSTTISVPELKTILDSMYSGVTKNEI